MAAVRDAERSREAILEAAERLFSERGFEGTTLSDIGAAAGLSRATPGYFFGSKERLYLAVLERVFADRQEATARAVEPVLEWSKDGGGDAELRAALAEAIEGYMAFLIERPSFGRFIAREELAGAHRLQAAHRESTALTDAFAAVREVAEERGLGSFEVNDAVLLWVSLTYAPLAHRSTLLVAVDRDLTEPSTRARHVAMAADQLMALLGRS